MSMSSFGSLSSRLSVGFEAAWRQCRGAWRAKPVFASGAQQIRSRSVLTCARRSVCWWVRACMRVLVRHLPLAQMTVHDRAVVVSVRTTPAPLPCQDDRRAAAAAANNTSSGSFPEPREQPIEHRFRCFGSDRHSRILLLSPTAARWVCRHLHHILLCRLPRLTSASVRAPTSWVVLPANFKPAFARRRLAPLSAPMPLLHGRILLLCSTRGFGAHKTKNVRADGALANGCGAPTTGRAHRTALGHSTRPHISASRHGHERGKRTWRSVKYWHVAIRPEIACGSVNAPGEEPWVFKGVRPCARRAVYEWRSRECCERALEDAIVSHLPDCA